MRAKFARLTVISTLAMALVAVSAGVAAAGPEEPHGMGVMEPDGISEVGCPWPDGANDFLEAQGVLKCLPQMIAWSEGHGVRVVTDPMIATGLDGSGWVTFWCQSNLGFKYEIGAVGLEPHSRYEVVASEGSDTWDLGTLRTDARGNGIVAGVVKLPPGEYEWTIEVGSVLMTDPADLPGFGVF